MARPELGLVALVFALDHSVPMGLGSGPSPVARGRRRRGRRRPRRLRGPDRRRVGVGRVRRDREPGRRTVDLAGHEVVYASSSGSTVTRKATWAASSVAAGPARADRERRRAVRAGRGPDLRRRLRGDRRGDRPAGRGRRGRRFGRVGRCHRAASSRAPPRRRRPRARPRAAARRRGRQWRRHEREPRRLDGPGGAIAQSLSAAPVPVRAPAPTPTPSPRRPDRRHRRRRRRRPTPRRRRPRHRRPTRRRRPRPPTPTPTPTPTPARRRPRRRRRPPPRRRRPAPGRDAHRHRPATLLPDDATVTIEGVLTTRLGALESGRCGVRPGRDWRIGLYLDAASPAIHPAGTTIHVTGTLGTRYHQRVLRIAEADIAFGPAGDHPGRLRSRPVRSGRMSKGSRIVVQGAVIGGADTLADGLGIDIDDGSGVTRAVVGQDALGWRPSPPATCHGDGPLGQRDSGGTGLGGCRLYATLAGEFEIEAPPPTPARPPPHATPSPRPPRRRPPRPPSSRRHRSRA